MVRVWLWSSDPRKVKLGLLIVFAAMMLAGHVAPETVLAGPGGGGSACSGDCGP